MKFSRTTLLAVTALVATQSFAQPQGVRNDEILLGNTTDLSGPVASYGKPYRNGMQLAIDEINQRGGIHGRKVRVIFEDSAYDPKKAALAAEKLVNQDKIFMMIGAMGTAHNIASWPIQFEKNVINFLPLAASSPMYEPFHRLKYAVQSTYYDQLSRAVPQMVKDKGLKKPCIIYQDDDMGSEIKAGGEAGLKSVNMTFTETTSFKRGATDFSTQVSKMKAAGCDLVIMGTIIRETIGTINESRKLGFNPVFLATVAAYSDQLHTLGGKSMDGLYATMTIQHPYTDESEPIRVWASKYKAQFNADPTAYSVYGYVAMNIFANAAQKVGRNLTTDTFISVMDTFSMPTDIFGHPPVTFSPTKRLGAEASRLSQIQDGKWKVVGPYITAETATKK